MVAAQLNSATVHLVLQKQNSIIKSNSTKVSIWNWIPEVFQLIFFKYSIKSQRNKVDLLLVLAKGLYTTIESKLEITKTHNFSEIILEVESVIELCIRYQASLERLIVNSSDRNFEKSVRALILPIDELLDEFYSIISILKKSNQRTRIATTEVAKVAAQISQKTILKVMDRD